MVKFNFILLVDKIAKCAEILSLINKYEGKLLICNLPKGFIYSLKFKSKEIVEKFKEELSVIDVK